MALRVEASTDETIKGVLVGRARQAAHEWFMNNGPDSRPARNCFGRIQAPFPPAEANRLLLTALTEAIECAAISRLRVVAMKDRNAGLTG